MGLNRDERARLRDLVDAIVKTEPRLRDLEVKALVAYVEDLMEDAERNAECDLEHVDDLE